MKQDNHGMTAFLIAQSYMPGSIADLYGLTGVPDIILTKAI